MFVTFGVFFEFECCWTACLYKVLLMFPAHVKKKSNFVYPLFAYKNMLNLFKHEISDKFDDLE